MIYYTADTHYGHANIIKHSNRPFRDVEEHDRELVRRHNERVRPEDTVWHLGDVAKTAKDVKNLDLLNFRKMFILAGNHDHELRKGVNRLDRRDDIKIIGDIGSYTSLTVSHQFPSGQQSVVLSHFAMLKWDRSHYGTYHLHGHSHGQLPNDPTKRMIDVGVDVFNYYPIDEVSVDGFMQHKTFIPLSGIRQEGGGVGLDRDAYAKAERRSQYEALRKEFGEKDGYETLYRDLSDRLHSIRRLVDGMPVHYKRSLTSAILGQDKMDDPYQRVHHPVAPYDDAPHQRA